MGTQREIRTLKAELAAERERSDTYRAGLQRCAAVAVTLMRAAAVLEAAAQDLVTDITGIGPTGHIQPA